MISLNVPSYSPIARARATALSPSPQRAQWAWGLCGREWRLGIGDWLPLASGSPHLSQIGGVIGKTERQQLTHTHPDNGSSRSAPHTAQLGASTAANRALAPLVIRD